MSEHALDPDAQRYLRYWEPVLAPAAHRLLDRVTEPPSGLLDLGAGTGSLTLAAAQHWPQTRVVALDATAAMLAVARDRVARLPGEDPGRFTWLAADARDIPLDDDSVDVTLSSFVLQRIDQRPRLLAEVRRVLRPGGTFAFVTWLAGEVAMPADEVFAEVLTLNGVKVSEPGFRSPRPADYTSLGQARRELRAAGFDEVEVWADELRASWSPTDYLAFKEHYDEHELFEELDADTRESTRTRLRDALAELPGDSFEVRAPLVGGLGRVPSGVEERD